MGIADLTYSSWVFRAALGKFIAFAGEFVHQEEGAEGHGVHGELNEIGALLPLGLVELAIVRQGRVFDHANPRPQRSGKDAFGVRDPSAGITEKLHAAGIHAGGQNIGPALQRLERAEIGARRIEPPGEALGIQILLDAAGQ